jgi:hypothetical protein
MVNSCFLVLIKHPVLTLVLFTMPFSNSPFLAQNIAGISGMKPFNLLALGLIISWLWKGGGHSRDRLESKAVLIFIAYLGLFSFAFFRAAMNLDVLVFRYIGEIPTSTIAFFLQYWVRGFLFTISFIYILQLIRTPSQILGLTCLLLLSFIFFDIYSLLISYNVRTDNLVRFGLIDVFTASIGLHYNNVASIMMIGLPFAFGFSLQYGKKYMPIVLIMVIALIFSGSRGALLGGVVGCSFTLFMSVSDKFSKLIKPLSVIVGLLIVGYGLFSLLSQKEAELAINELSSGRVDNIWLPLVIEIYKSPMTLIFGNGYLGMIQSDTYVSTYNFYKSTHAHNAYLNLIMDGGAIFVGLLFLLINYSFKKAITLENARANLVYYGLVGSIIAYLIAAWFGRQFLPATDNMMLFPVLGLITVYYRHSKQEVVEK